MTAVEVKALIEDRAKSRDRSHRGGARLSRASRPFRPVLARPLRFKHVIAITPPRAGQSGAPRSSSALARSSSHAARATAVHRAYTCPRATPPCCLRSTTMFERIAIRAVALGLSGLITLTIVSALASTADQHHALACPGLRAKASARCNTVVVVGQHGSDAAESGAPDRAASEARSGAQSLQRARDSAPGRPDGALVVQLVARLICGGVQYVPPQDTSQPSAQALLH